MQILAAKYLRYLRRNLADTYGAAAVRYVDRKSCGIYALSNLLFAMGTMSGKH